MMSESVLTIAIGVPLVLVSLVPYVVWMKKRDRRTLAAYEEAAVVGLNESPSLHPVIDPDVCIGSASCVTACPEKNVLDVVEGRAKLIEAVSCIGHGRCFHACPVEAISLVFGTAKRGVDIPHVSETFETNLPGIYIAGELGGMGLIRNAVTQGAQAVSAIVNSGVRAKDGALDVLVVGAGPAGLSAAMQAMSEGLSFACVDQGTFGGAIRQYPRRKLVMTQPFDIPMYGKVRAREMLKEELLDVWTDAVDQCGLEVQTGRRVERIAREGDHYRVLTSAQMYLARHVILAIGRRGTPRRLGIPGEDLSKVTYGLLAPEQFRGLKSLVVGEGEAALEAACSLANEPDTRVTLSYRGDRFTRPKVAIRERVDKLVAEGKVDVMFSSNPTRIDEHYVELAHDGSSRRLENDQVFVFAGGELPTRFLRETGVRVETKFGTR